MGRQRGLPGGAGPDSQTVAFAFHFPAHPLRSQGANVLGDANLEAEEAAEGK